MFAEGALFLVPLPYRTFSSKTWDFFILSPGQRRKTTASLSMRKIVEKCLMEEVVCCKSCQEVTHSLHLKHCSGGAHCEHALDQKLGRAHSSGVADVHFESGCLVHCFL